MTEKSIENTQFARTSDTDGNQTVPEGYGDNGCAPLADNNSRLIVRLAGQGGFFPGDVIPVSFSTPPRYKKGSTGAYIPAAGLVISAVPAMLFSIYGFSDYSDLSYVHIFNRAAVPISGLTIPDIIIPLGPGPNSFIPEQYSSDILYNNNNTLFSIGITIALSFAKFVFTSFPVVANYLYVNVVTDNP